MESMRETSRLDIARLNLRSKNLRLVAHWWCDGDGLGPDTGIPRHGQISVQATRSIDGPSELDTKIEVATDKRIALISLKRGLKTNSAFDCSQAEVTLQKYSALI